MGGREWAGLAEFGEEADEVGEFAACQRIGQAGGHQRAGFFFLRDLRERDRNFVARAVSQDQVRGALRNFPDLALETADFETAAEYFNICRGKGVQGSLTDFLICAVAARRQLEIFTTDGDFQHYRKHLPIALYAGAQA